MEHKPTNDRPLFRVTFSRIEQDKDGNDIVTRPKEIGAIWPRKNGKQGGILSFAHIPVELAQRKGVIFVLPVDQADNGGSQ
mgnify:CR=1 FL=1|jgi:hypothetical protein